MIISKLEREKLQWSGKFTFIEKKNHIEISENLTLKCNYLYHF